MPDATFHIHYYWYVPVFRFFCFFFNQPNTNCQCNQCAVTIFNQKQTFIKTEQIKNAARALAQQKKQGKKASTLYKLGAHNWTEMQALINKYWISFILFCVQHLVSILFVCALFRRIQNKRLAIKNEPKRANTLLTKERKQTDTICVELVKQKRFVIRAIANSSQKVVDFLEMRRTHAALALIVKVYIHNNSSVCINVFWYRIQNPYQLLPFHTMMSLAVTPFLVYLFIFCTFVELKFTISIEKRLFIAQFILPCCNDNKNNNLNSLILEFFFRVFWFVLYWVPATKIN